MTCRHQVGRAGRYLYAVAGTEPNTTSKSGIIKYDTVDGTVRSHELDADTTIGEAVFVPAPLVRATRTRAG
jgi:carotenoid cleavage dioxygenase-like enzyme